MSEHSRSIAEVAAFAHQQAERPIDGLFVLSGVTITSEIIKVKSIGYGAPAHVFAFALQLLQRLQLQASAGGDSPITVERLNAALAILEDRAAETRQ